ncbi:MAG: GIY-YIG nuclease family protein [Elusimicrobiota bacterium]|jgi:putative endonuclease|nr:GIY-YIG nuclease family protein [Elusimicrobiota bacterium]
MKGVAYVYFMSNQYNNVLYIGVTSNLACRVSEHKAKSNNSFTAKYKINKLVYFESTASIKDAIAREKQFKNWKREWKNKLINGMNPDWKDLSESMGVDVQLISEAKGWYKGEKIQ